MAARLNKGEFARDLLAVVFEHGGELDAGVVRAWCKRTKVVSFRTMKEAKAALRIRSERRGGKHGRWVWCAEGRTQRPSRPVSLPAELHRPKTAEPCKCGSGFFWHDPDGDELCAACGRSSGRRLAKLNGYDKWNAFMRANGRDGAHAKANPLARPWRTRWTQRPPAERSSL